MERALPPALRRAALDWLAPLTILVIGAVNLTGQADTRAYPGSPAKHVAFLLVGVSCLGLRRRAPLVAPTAAIVVVTWWSSLWPVHDQGPFEGFVILVGASYSLGSIRDRWTWRIGLGVVVTWFVLGLFAGAVGGRTGDVAPLAVWLAVGFAIGTLISRRTDQAREATESARALASEQELRIGRAIEDERSRIARELHDVVAHGLSVIVVQAGAERRSLQSAPDLDSLDAALGSIEKAGRDALVDLRCLLGLLRRTGEPLSLEPQPGLGQIDQLVATAREAGLDVDVEVLGDMSPLPPGLDLTAYRIVQEALTNTLKHAGARSVRVVIALERNQLDVEVSDDGPTGPPAAVAVEGAGHGLIGMRERVKIFGGTVDAGGSESGGWTVHARLPLTAGTAS